MTRSGAKRTVEDAAHEVQSNVFLILDCIPELPGMTAGAIAAQVEELVKRELGRHLAVEEFCPHDNSGISYADGTKTCRCVDCGKVLYASAGGPDENHPAHGM